MRLRVLGGLSLDGEPGDGEAPSLGPRRLALLALVAVAGRRGISRERILGILWSETPEEQARHSLSQTIYTIRRETGRECIAGTSHLRLDASLASDVSELRDALDADDLARAAELHAGPFLDGFYLANAPEFERWVEETRAQLQQSVVRAIEMLVRRAPESGSPCDAAQWWHRLATIDPFNATYAAGRVRTLLDCGDHAGALRAAREYQSRVRRELEVEPDPAVERLVFGLRGAASPIAPSLVPGAGADSTFDGGGAVAAAARPAAVAGDPHARQRMRRPVVVIAGLTIFSIAVAIVLGQTGRRRSDPGGTGARGRSPGSVPEPALAGRPNSSVANAIYEEGLRAFYLADHPAVVRLMSAALERDSTFALAAYYAWRSAASAEMYDQAARFLPLSRRLAARSADRERLWIEGMLACEGAPLDEILATAREMTRRFPADPDGLFLLGHALFVAGDWPGAVTVLERAVAVDSAAGATTGAFCRICNVMYEMSRAYMWWDSAAAAERTMRRLVALRPDDEAGWAGLIEPLLRQGRRAEAEGVIARIARMSPIRHDYGFDLDRDLIRQGRTSELEARLIPALRDAQPDGRGEGPWLLAIALRNQGRLREAEALAAGGVLPGTTWRLEGQSEDLNSRAIIALESGAARDAARRFLDIVAADRASTRNEPGFHARAMAWHITLAGTALAAAGDTAAVRALADSVERIGARSSFGRDPRLHHFLRGLLLQREGRHADAVVAFRASLFSLTDGYTRANLELARSLLALGRHDEAIGVLQPALRGGIDGSNTYGTLTEIHEALALAFDAAGRRDSAAVHYAAVERAWRHADPAFEARYDAAAARAGAKTHRGDAR